QVIKLQPRPASAYIAIAGLQLRLNDPSKAASYAQQALALRPRDPNAIDALVRADLMAGDVAKAERDLAPLQKAFSGSTGVSRLTALVQLALKKPEAARATYSRMLESNPGDLDALSVVLSIDAAAGRARDAMARIDARVKAGNPSVGLLI